jgi:hypothetical protein
MSFSLLFLPLPIARLDERDELVERMREQIEDDACSPKYRSLQKHAAGVKIGCSRLACS